MNKPLPKFFIFFLLVAFLNGIQIQAANRHNKGEGSDTEKVERSNSSNYVDDTNARRAKYKKDGVEFAESSEDSQRAKFNKNGGKGNEKNSGSDTDIVQPINNPSADNYIEPPVVQGPPSPPPSSKYIYQMSAMQPSSSNSSDNNDRPMQQAFARYNQGSSSNIVKYNYKINNIQIKAPVMTQSMKPGVNFYNQGNYVGAIQSLKEVVKKEPKNEYAKYYLALAYTRLGFKDKAEEQYKAIVDSGKNYALALYSQRALDCTGNPGNTACMYPKKENVQTLIAQNNAQITRQLQQVKVQRQQQLIDYGASVRQYNEDLAQYNKNRAQFYKDQGLQNRDIQKFIDSGQRVHPAAMDRITREKMERKVQEAQRRVLDVEDWS